MRSRLKRFFHVLVPLFATFFKFAFVMVSDQNPFYGTSKCGKKAVSALGVRSKKRKITLVG